MPVTRKNISKKLRFEVLKRDSFTCQYCGSSAPKVILHIDHIKPVADGGDNNITNLIAACDNCNMGKGARLLNDDAEVVKQKKQLDQLNEKRQQLEMMVEWRESVQNLLDQELQIAVDEFEKLAVLVAVGKEHQLKLRKLLKKHGLQTVLEAIEIGAEEYFLYEYCPYNGQCPTFDSCKTAFEKLPGICYMLTVPHDIKTLYYIKGIVKRRMHCKEGVAMGLLKKANKFNADFNDLSKIAKSARDWSDWHSTMSDLVNRLEAQNAN